MIKDKESANKNSYIKLVLIFALYILFWIFIIPLIKSLNLLMNLQVNLSRIVPTENLFEELGILYLIILPLTSIIGLVFGIYLLTPIIILLHKFLFRTKNYYGIQYESHVEKTHFLSQGFYPVLMAINLAFLFTGPEISDLVIDPSLAAELSNIFKMTELLKFLTLSILLIFTFSIALFLFSPVWCLQNSGIIYTNKSKIQHSEEFITFNSLGNWFKTLLKSYAGIGALITYIFIIYRVIINYKTPMDIIILLLWLGLPFYLVLSMIPALIFNDLIKLHRIKFTRSLGNKLGIRKKAIISLELKDIE